MKIELDNGFVSLAKKYAEMDISVSLKRKEWCEHYDFWHQQYVYYSNEDLMINMMNWKH